jgi:hypothetical protein
VYLAGWAFVIALSIPVSRWLAMAGYALATALIAGYAAVQLWRMPPQMRLLLRTRRIRLVLGTVCGVVVVELITAAVTPAVALPNVIFATTLFIYLVSMIVIAILRGKGSKTGRGKT